MQPEELFALVFIVGMFTGVFIIYMGLRQRSQQLEMRHRERMAMIERGQIPLAEPSGATPYSHRLDAGAARSSRSSRSLSLGIIVVGFGLAMMTIISIAGNSAEVGIGVGGAVAILGGAFIVRSLVVSASSSSSAPVQPPLPPNRPFDAN
jgi:hypothetical protein